MNAFANPAHEAEAAALVRKELPGAFLTTSTELLPAIRFYDRVSTTALNAYVGPILDHYLAQLQRRLSEAGFSRRAADHAIQRRRDDAGGGAQIAGADAAFRSRRRPDRRPRRGAAARHGQLHRGRHGRHQLRSGAGRENAGGDQGRRDRPAALRAADARHPHHRRRRRLDRLDRPGRPVAHGAAQRRRDAGAGLLRPRRRAADHHRRQPGARLSERRFLLRRPHQARCRKPRAT